MFIVMLKNAQLQIYFRKHFWDELPDPLPDLSQSFVQASEYGEPLEQFFLTILQLTNVKHSKRRS